MNYRKAFISTCHYGWHKGFYNDGDYSSALGHIKYTDFFDDPYTEEFPYDSAEVLLCGSCNIFAFCLQKCLGYNAYVIEPNDKNGCHMFCQIYKNRTWYYIDARGITTSFDEFMEVAKKFVSDEFTIRRLTDDDIEEWENECDYNEEAYAFAEAIIEKYKDCYTL